MLFFTSDLHLGHANAIGFTKRPYQTVEEMSHSLIVNMNETVQEEDELWILGDFSYRLSKEQVRHLRGQISCKHVHLVTGNHDKDYTQDRIFQSVQDYKELKTEYGKVVLFHYPIFEWNAAHYGAIHLHGHIHSTGEYNENNLKSKYTDRFPFSHAVKGKNMGLRIYDVGVDANHFRPISLQYIAGLMNLAPTIKE